MITKETIQQLIAKALPHTQLEVRGDDGTHFEAEVVSPAFEGLSRVKQHQLVYATLGERMLTGEIHALALTTYAPSQWTS